MGLAHPSEIIARSKRLKFPLKQSIKDWIMIPLKYNMLGIIRLFSYSLFLLKKKSIEYAVVNLI